jgi:hypothetical protein
MHLVCCSEYINQRRAFFLYDYTSPKILGVSAVNYHIQGEQTVVY